MLDSNKIIKSVEIYYNRSIRGFIFYDNKRVPIKKIGDTYQDDVKEIVLKDNEVIIGVAAKLSGWRQSFYTDF